MRGGPLRAEGGGIVTGWLLKIVLVLGIVGIVAFDAIAITVAHVTASDDAHSIGEAASDAIVVSHASPDRARELALDRASTRGIRLRPEDLVVQDDGTVTVTIRRTANTVVAQRLGPLVQYTKIVEVYTAGPDTR